MIAVQCPIRGGYFDVPDSALADQAAGGLNACSQCGRNHVLLDCPRCGRLTVLVTTTDVAADGGVSGHCAKHLAQRCREPDFPPEGEFTVQIRQPE